MQRPHKFEGSVICIGSPVQLRLCEEAMTSGTVAHILAREEEMLHFIIARAAQQFLKKVPFQGELLPRLPQVEVTTEGLNMNRVLYDPVIVAMDGSTSTSLTSWLVPARGKACYNYV